MRSSLITGVRVNVKTPVIYDNYFRKPLEYPSLSGNEGLRANALVLWPGLRFRLIIVLMLMVTVMSEINGIFYKFWDEKI